MLEWTANKNQISSRPPRRFRMKTPLCHYPWLSRCRRPVCACSRQPVFPSRRIAACGWRGCRATLGRTLPRILSFLRLLCRGCLSCAPLAVSWCSSLALSFRSSRWWHWNSSFRWPLCFPSLAFGLLQTYCCISQEEARLGCCSCAGFPRWALLLSFDSRTRTLQ